MQKSLAHAYLGRVWGIPPDVATIMQQPRTAEEEELSNLWIEYTSAEIRRQRDIALTRGEIDPRDGLPRELLKSLAIGKGG